MSSSVVEEIDGDASLNDREKRRLRRDRKKQERERELSKKKQEQAIQDDERPVVAYVA